MNWLGLLGLASLIAAAGARDVKIERNSSALQFEYQWDAEAAAIPALNRKLRSRADAAYREALKFAREDQASARKDKRPFHRHSFGVNWEAVGQTARLLSIGAEMESFTGGAHPNHNVDAELWDRRLGRQITVPSLFIRASSFTASTRTAYCKALDKERLARRNGERIDGPFDECPKYGELAIVPRDREPDGRFEEIDFIAAPYTAGPYVEGEYGIALPVTRQILAAMKPIYRSSFEAQRQ
ncbi:MAG TPA: DUF4163 domain-containing protein [Sphingomicrobium sp.]|nr:DUF4163 domain-containing protein [Sphingomicrobium sp.]